MTTSPTEPPPQTDATPNIDARIACVDLLRGTVMVLMVLDHTRDFFMDMSFDPTDLSRTTPALFFTRWITHFCAPVFALLAGTGAFLASRGGRRGIALARFLVVRGLWLVALEQTVEIFGMLFRPTPGLFLALVLWSIGWSFVVLGVLVALGIPSRIIGALGLTIIATHGLSALLPPSPWTTVLFSRGLVGNPTSGPVLLVGYAIIPWAGVVLSGYGLGELLDWKPQIRRRALVGLSVVTLALFAGLRATNLYGDPNPWSMKESPLLTVLSFLNTSKYPPSLLFLLMTLGPALGVLALYDAVGEDGPIRTGLRTLGRVPLFYYLLQWYVIHGLAVLVAVLRGQPLGWLFPGFPPVAPPPESQFGLPFVYGMWILVVVLLYLASRWFAGVKKRRRDLWWLAYL
ncbi:MAG: heparan-alpha-glucosaminide N-acetyltransferase domain-containing protein [Isosphaeraceae bacterium]